jgi:hypothetical protein
MLKAAQETLVAACGGVSAASEICGFGTSTVSRWADTDMPEIMSTVAVLKLQDACGRPYWTEALAAAQGLKVSADGQEDSASDNVMGRFFAVLQSAADFSKSGTEAFADLQFTPNEADRSIQMAETLIDTLVEFKKAAASGRAAGGLKVVG